MLIISDKQLEVQQSLVLLFQSVKFSIGISLTTTSFTVTSVVWSPLSKNSLKYSSDVAAQ